MITVKRYSFATLYFVLNDDYGNAVNITNYGIVFTVKNKEADNTIIRKTIGNGVNYVFPELGSFCVYLTSLDTKYEEGKYYCSIFISPNGTNIGTLGSNIPIYNVYNSVLNIEQAVNPY